MIYVVAFIAPALLVAAVCLLLLAGASDVATRRVPNWACAALATIGLALQLISGRAQTAVGSALLVFLLGALCWRRGWLGGGDVKLLAATALLVAPWRVPSLLLAVALAGAALALAYLLLRLLPAGPQRQLPDAASPCGSGWRATASRIARIERWRIRRGAPLPYATAICAGASFVLLSH